MIGREYNHQIGLETSDQSSGGIKRILHLFEHHRTWVVRSHQRRMGDSDSCNCHYGYHLTWSGLRAETVVAAQAYANQPSHWSDSQAENSCGARTMFVRWLTGPTATAFASMARSLSRP